MAYYGTALRVCTAEGSGQIALEVIRLMQEDNVQVTNSHYIDLVKALSKNGMIDEIKKLIDSVPHPNEALLEQVDRSCQAL